MSETDLKTAKLPTLFPSDSIAKIHHESRVTNRGRLFQVDYEKDGGPYPLKTMDFWYDQMLADITVHDSVVTYELFDSESPYQMRGRPVVYLDQNKWIEIAKVTIGVSKASTSERSAIEKIILLANEKKIILPLSVAHYIETTKKHGQQRIDVAKPMLELSRGWQMENPYTVRDRELTQAMARYTRSTLNSDILYTPFSLKPWISLIPDMYAQHLLSLIAMGFDIDDAERDLSVQWSTSNASMLSDDTESLTHILDSIDDWCNSHKLLSEEIARDPNLRKNIRAVTGAKLIFGDMAPELNHALLQSGMTGSKLDFWVKTHLDATISKSPALSLYREVMHTRQQNPTLKWTSNDFNDVQCLTCAAAYAEFIICEKSTLDHMNRAKRHLPKIAHLSSTFSGTVEKLEREVKTRILAGTLTNAIW